MLVLRLVVYGKTVLWTFADGAWLFFLLNEEGLLQEACLCATPSPSEGRLSKVVLSSVDSCTLVIVWIIGLVAGQVRGGSDDVGVGHDVAVLVRPVEIVDSHHLVHLVHQECGRNERMCGMFQQF